MVSQYHSVNMVSYTPPMLGLHPTAPHGSPPLPTPSGPRAAALRSAPPALERSRASHDAKAAPPASHPAAVSRFLLQFLRSGMANIAV